MKFEDWSGFLDRWLHLCSVMRGGPDGIDYEEVFEGRGGTPKTRVDPEPGWVRHYPLLWSMDAVLERVVHRVGEKDFQLWVLLRVQGMTGHEAALDERCPYSRALVYSHGQAKAKQVEAAFRSILSEAGWLV